MGRKSKLTEAQWAEVERRLLAGEKRDHLAREFKVSGPAISQRVGKKIVTVKAVANQLVSAEQALRNLPIRDQVQALNLANDLRTTSVHLAGASAKAAAISHRLTSIASTEMEKVDDAEPMGDLARLKSVSTLMNLAKDAAHIPLNLLAANKERMKALGDEPPEVPAAVSGMSASDAARFYQDFIGAG